MMTHLIFLSRRSREERQQDDDDIKQRSNIPSEEEAIATDSQLFMNATCRTTDYC